MSSLVNRVDVKQILKIGRKVASASGKRSVKGNELKREQIPDKSSSSEEEKVKLLH